MIVMFCSQYDACAASVYTCLRGRGAVVMLVDETFDFGTLGLNWRVDDPAGNGYFLLKGKRVDLSDLTGVFLRPGYQVPPNPALSKPDQQYITWEQFGLAQGFFRAIPGRVVNRPHPNNMGQPVFTHWEKVQSIEKCGFKLPLTYVAASRKALRAFPLAGNGAMVLAGGLNAQFPPRLLRSPELEQYIETSFGKETISPTYIQNVPKGRIVQVFTVGRHAFAVEGAPHLLGETAALDQTLPAYDLSRDQREACCRLARELHLDFAYFLLVEGAGGVWYCLNGSEPFDLFIFEQCEEKIRTGICETLASLLEGKEEKSTA